MADLESVGATFAASIKSIGTAITMTAIGFYLHSRAFITAPGKRALALMSQQVTFPLFLFTKIIFCNQDWSDKPCPDVTTTLHDTWMLLLWPIYMVGMGLAVGSVVASITKTPKRQVPSVLATVSLANNTALPVTLLSVIHSAFPTTSDLGRIDPTLFLSVYLIVYPILQWGIGGYILAPHDTHESSLDEEVPASLGESFRRIMKTLPMSDESIRHRNVLNNRERVRTRKNRTGYLTSSDEGCYMTELDLKKLGQLEQERQDAAYEHALWLEVEQGHQPPDEESSNAENCPLVIEMSTENYDSIHASADFRQITKSHRTLTSQYETTTAWETFKNILEHCVNPPMIGAVLGLLCAVTPVRGLLVDLVNRHSGAPLQWLFDGLYKVGQLAVPDNMLILGCNLSSSYNSYFERKRSRQEKGGLFSRQTAAGIIIGKMLVMPFVGILSAYVLKHYVLHLSDEIAGAFYLVLMIVFLTPTANNVMIMIELADADAGILEGVANVIALQYAVAPVILSLTMTIAIGVASEWS